MIIGFTGRARSGKSTASNHLLSSGHRPSKRINFKEGIIQEMQNNLMPLLNEFGVFYDMSIDQLFSEKPPMMRKLMQLYGTEVRRGDDPNYWVYKWLDLYRKTPRDIDVIVDDVRFLNEAAAIRDMGGVLIRIVREGQEQDESTHASEREMDAIQADFTIKAVTGDHEGLYRQLDAIMAQLSTVNDLSQG